MILGLTGPQSFVWVGSMIFLGILASSVSGGMASIMAWLSLALFLLVELLVLRFINTRRRSLISHTVSRWISLGKGRRFAGRGVSVAWGGKGHNAGERPY